MEPLESNLTASREAREAVARHAALCPRFDLSSQVVAGLAAEYLIGVRSSCTWQTPEGVRVVATALRLSGAALDMRVVVEWRHHLLPPLWRSSPAKGYPDGRCITWG